MICESCGNEYSRIASHWSQSSCLYKKLSDYQKQIITGCLMGDGTLNRQSKNSCLEVGSVQKEYLEYLDDRFPTIGSGVSMKQTGIESLEAAKSNGLNVSNNADKYKDFYIWRTMKHPEISEFSSWYSSGEKVYPNITLTKTILKHWYCGDGNRDKNRIRIGCNNEIKNKNKLNNLFDSSNLPKPNTYLERSISFTVEDSTKLWNYMGKPLPGFEYKWPNCADDGKEENISRGIGNTCK